MHLAWWRSSPPRRHLVALAALFVAVAFAAIALWAFVRLPSLAAQELPAVLALYLGAAACYLIVYTGVEQSSPTLIVVRALERSAHGCSADELAALITDDLFVRPRLEALAADGVVMPVRGGWQLTARGRRAARTAAALAGIFRIREAA